MRRTPPSLRLAVGGKRWGAKGSRSSCRLCTVEMRRKGAGEGKRDKKADTIPQQPRQNRPRKDQRIGIQCEESESPHRVRWAVVLELSGRKKGTESMDTKQDRFGSDEGRAKST